MALELIQSFLQQYPRSSIIILAFLVSFFISIINYFVLDKEKMHSIKARQKQIQEEMKVHKGNPSKLAELQKEMFSHMGSSFKHSLKPMLITFIPIIIIFATMKNMLSTTAIASTWFWWYLGASLIATMFFRKLLKLP